MFKHKWLLGLVLLVALLVAVGVAGCKKEAESTEINDSV